MFPGSREGMLVPRRELQVSQGFSVVCCGTVLSVYLGLLLSCSVCGFLTLYSLRRARDDIFCARLSLSLFCMKWPALWPSGLLALLIAVLDNHWSPPVSVHALSKAVPWTADRKVAVRYGTYTMDP